MFRSCITSLFVVLLGLSASSGAQTAQANLRRLRASGTGRSAATDEFDRDAIQ